jgi:hypothetical protein
VRVLSEDFVDFGLLDQIVSWCPEFIPFRLVCIAMLRQKYAWTL